MRANDDLLNIYNSLYVFSAETLEGEKLVPIKVTYEGDSNSLVFEQRGKKVYVPLLNYYAGMLKTVKDTWLLPEDYRYLMSTMAYMMDKGILLHDRVCISPEIYGFDVYETSVTPGTFRDGPRVIARLRFVSGNSWLFRLITKIKYKNVL